jgi:tRNA1Val (adenine37-N6)-methyltransferase
MIKPKDIRPFNFKQFSMTHHRSTMKIGTDAVLLSAWVNINNINNVLDIGTGSGIIALLLASRQKDCYIDAVELDKMSAIEAGENFKNSPYANRLKIINEDFKNFNKSCNKQYDLIISNPPFFINDLRSENSKRKNARHSDSLNYNDLIEGAKKLMLKNGRFCVVLPYYESKKFIETAKENGLTISRELLIFPKPCKEPNRINIEFQLNKTEKTIHEKFILREENGKFTEQYIKLLGNYYLNITQQ